MDPVALSRDRDRPLHRRPHAETIDVGHRERRHTGLLDVVALAGIDIAQPEQHALPAARRAAQVGGERIAREPERDREGHPVHVPGRRRLGSVDVAVRIDPDHAGPLPRTREAGEGAHRHRMVTAEDKREVAGACDVRHDARQLLARSHDLDDVVRARTFEHPLRVDLLVGVRRETLIGIGDVDVAAVTHAKADLGELRDEPAVADAGRTHVDPATIATEIHRHPDDLDDRTALHATDLLRIPLTPEPFSGHRAVCFAAVAARGWKIAWMTPSAASSSPTNSRTFTRAKPRRILSTRASNRAVSPGRTMRLKCISSMPAKSPRPSRYSGSAMAITVAAWASDSTRMTPGTIGLPGKWPFRYHSSPVKVCSATARTPGSSSVTRSMRRKGSRCGMSASMPARSSDVMRRV